LDDLTVVVVVDEELDDLRVLDCVLSVSLSGGDLLDGGEGGDLALSPTRGDLLDGGEGGDLALSATRGSAVDLISVLDPETTRPSDDDTSVEGEGLVNDFNFDAACCREREGGDASDCDELDESSSSSELVSSFLLADDLRRSLDKEPNNHTETIYIIKGTVLAHWLLPWSHTSISYNTFQQKRSKNSGLCFFIVLLQNFTNLGGLPQGDSSTSLRFTKTASSHT